MEAVNNIINYNYLNKALEYYKFKGYKYIEVPWIVRPEITKITFNNRNNEFETKNGDLVGSAEQSFIQLMLDKKIKPGKYCTLTPCFRYENDETHNYHFMKVELFYFQSNIIDNDKLHNVYDTVIEDAHYFFSNELFNKLHISGQHTDIGYDLYLNGLEIGSYGYRSYSTNINEFSWVYGTGLAEPRFSQAFNLTNKEVKILTVTEDAFELNFETNVFELKNKKIYNDYDIIIFKYNDQFKIIKNIFDLNDEYTNKIFLIDTYTEFFDKLVKYYNINNTLIDHYVED